MNIILLGPPGAGKGTQAHRLEQVLHLCTISSGDIFRAIGRQNTPLAREVRSYLDRGDYVPDQLTIELVLARLAQTDAQSGFILDGFPRTGAQAEALDRALEQTGSKVDLALYITAPTEVLMDRIMGRIVCPQCSAIYNLASRPPRVPGVCDVCGHGLERRTDEDPNVVRTRLEAYLNQTQPVVAYYRNRGCLVEIDGSQPMGVVEDQVDAALAVRGAR